MRYTRRSGYTLVELLLSTALGLLVLAAVIQMFSVMGGTINDSRAGLAMNEDLRRVAAQLRSDLDGLTVIPAPPRPPENGEGYLQIIEGPMGVAVPGHQLATDTDYSVPDTTVGDTDDIILFTSRKEEGFRARKNGSVEKFDAAEVAWFVRGNKLYRKVIGIDADGAAVSGAAIRYTPTNRVNVENFFRDNDISVNAVTAMDGTGDVLYERNTLASLTRPDCRYGAQWNGGLNGIGGVGLWHFAYGSGGAGSVWCSSGAVPGLGLPLASECYVDTGNAADSGSPWKSVKTGDLGAGSPWDLWRNPMPWGNVGRDNTNSAIPPRFDNTLTTAGGLTVATGYSADTDRSTEELVLSNVLSFDVKVWDPGAPVRADTTGAILLYPGDPGWTASSNLFGVGAFVDLGYTGTDPLTPDTVSDASDFSDVRNFVRNGTMAYAYDHTPSVDMPIVPRMWQTPSAADIRLPRVYDTWSTHYEAELYAARGLQMGPYKYAAPYMKRLRGIQVTIRAFEPDSRQVRQITLVHAFPQS